MIVPTAGFGEDEMTWAPEQLLAQGKTRWVAAFPILIITA